MSALDGRCDRKRIVTYPLQPQLGRFSSTHQKNVVRVVSEGAGGGRSRRCFICARRRRLRNLVQALAIDQSAAGGYRDEEQAHRMSLTRSFFCFRGDMVDDDVGSGKLFSQPTYTHTKLPKRCVGCPLTCAISGELEQLGNVLVDACFFARNANVGGPKDVGTRFVLC